MEKTNIVIGFKQEGDTDPDIVFCGDINGCLKAYKDALHGDKYHFVGMLRKPRWFKNGKPPLVQKQRDAAHQKLEDELVRKSKEAKSAQDTADKAKETVSSIEEQIGAKEQERVERSTPKQSVSKKVAKPKD